jgi:sensor domain CHASE-containing protein
MGERSGKLIQQVILPIAILVAVAMSVVVGFVWFSASNQDEIALQQSIKSVAEAVHRRTDQVGRLAKDYSWWNDSAQNLAIAFDPEWADLNIGFYIYENYAYEFSFVVDGQNRTLYASEEMERLEADAFESLAHGLDRLRSPLPI